MLQRLMVCLKKKMLMALLVCMPIPLLVLLNVSCFLCSGGFSVFAGVGERTREGNDLYREMIESGVIKLGDKQVMICC